MGRILGPRVLYWSRSYLSGSALGLSSSRPRINAKAEEIAAPTASFNMLDIASGPWDHLREADERAAERNPRKLRARVKAARSVAETTLGLAETVARDLGKATLTWALFAVGTWHKKGV